jgi:hypothetical protein
MKTPQSLLSNIIIILLLFSLALGAFWNSLVRSTSEITADIIFYGDLSSLFLGIPFLVMGAFFLLPARWQIGFIEKTWLRKLPLNKLKPDTPWLVGLMLFALGCVFIYSLFISPTLFNSRSIPTIPINAGSTPSIPREPTWTLRP